MAAASRLPRAAGPHAPQQPERSAVATLLAQIARLRGSLEAVRRETIAAAGDAEEAELRWQRALCDLAARQLDSLTIQLGQLRAGHPVDADRDEVDGPEGEFPADPLDRPQPRVGSAEWHLLSDIVDWSDDLFDIFGRDPGDGPLSLDDLPSWFDPADQPRLTAMVTDCLVDGKPIDGEFRIRRPDGAPRTLHVVGEPVLDAGGATESMWTVVRDVTELRRSRQAVRESESTLQRERHFAAADRRIAQELHESVLPPWRGALHLPAGDPASLTVAGHHFPAAADTPVRGVWYDALPLPGGHTLLGVGDVAGRGVPAAAGMTMLLGALRGMALGGTDPAALLGRANKLLEVSAQPVLVGTVCCRYDPATRTLRWARAAHVSPLLFRDGAGRPLTAPEGMLLGATADTSYAQVSEPLQPGDLLLLHTPGLGARSPEPARERLLALAPRFAAAPGAQDCLRAVVEEFGGGRRGDDACVLVAKVTG
ncbi:SpoIIE family protein phosphatase [Streptomyces sp. NBC_01808]|uniref:PP2C family protein-serine/threonine phosphatase n=1 Tax=Streptomyces sp. NBC_01808 TaxID=2975947 RepID=UPI002DDAB7B9|nr:SpoIIE family protein phosphatase [Streptomyces sp. NBC_01808]WSA36390.1 SpoIIE family protein phosphatase [Streptomyces sp. NBC_01808]